MISIVKQHDVYIIRFPYDPDLVDMIRELPKRDYIPNGKVWSIPANQLGFLLNQLKASKWKDEIQVISEENIDKNEDLNVTTNIPNVDISSVKTYVKDGSKLYEHQKDFMKFSLHRQLVQKNLCGFLLADEPGCGKTLEGMNLALYNRRNLHFNHCLILCCINSAKYNWISDIIDHTDGKYHPYMLGTRLTKKGTVKKEDISSKNRYEDLCKMQKYGGATNSPLPYFIVTNIEALRYKEGKHYLVTEKIIELINSGQLNMIIIDEIHKNASPQSAQGKQLLEIKKKTQNRCMWLPMTGTPIVNRPTDVFLPLRLIGGTACTSFYNWCEEYCVSGGYGITDIIGYKNIGQLKGILEYNMLRRLKKDVLDLPDIIFNDVYVENTSYQRRLYNKQLAEVANNKDAILHSMNPLTAFLRLRQVNGSPELVDGSLAIDDKYIDKVTKLKELMRLLHEIHERNEKVVVFSQWVEPLNTLYRYVSREYGVCRFDGSLSISERNSEKYRFLHDDNCTVMLGTVGAAGVSHTFTVATNVIFYDEPWTYADKKQAWERVHRIGTKEHVNVYTLLSMDTVDTKVNELVYKKKGISQYIVDNSIDLRQNPDLFDLLIS